MPNQIEHIPTPLLKQILREWCSQQFNWTDEETDVVVNATRDRIHNKARQEVLVEYKGFLTCVATQPDLNGTELALAAKKRLEELELELERVLEDGSEG